MTLAPKKKENFDNILFIDTETTGREVQDRIFQVAYDFGGQEYVEMFKPPVPLCIEAMEATGYTNKDVEDKQPFAGSQMQKHLQEILALPTTIFVAHNAPFDTAMLAKDDVHADRVIDTLKVAQDLDPDAKLGAYRLQYLRYALDLDVKDARAHDALGDVRVLRALFERLYDKMIDIHATHDATINEMIAISQRPVLIKRIPFGKYAGKLLKDVHQEDPGYLEWLLQQKEQDTENPHDQNADWIYTLKTLLQK